MLLVETGRAKRKEMVVCLSCRGGQFYNFVRTARLTWVPVRQNEPCHPGSSRKREPETLVSVSPSLDRDRCEKRNVTCFFSSHPRYSCVGSSCKQRLPTATTVHASSAVVCVLISVQPPRASPCRLVGKTATTRCESSIIRHDQRKTVTAGPSSHCFDIQSSYFREN